MIGIVREPLMISGAYAPCILDCGRMDAPGRPLTIAPGEADLPSAAYRLVRISDGAATCRLDGTAFRCTEGTVLLLAPGAAGTLAMAPGARCIQVSFDVIHQRRTPPGERRRMRHVDPGLQPGPQEVWGVDLPVLLSRSSSGSAALLLVRLASTYWRDPLSHHLANTELAIWLADLVARAAGRATHHLLPEARDPLAASMDLAGTALSHRLNVDDLVHAAGLGRSTYYQHFRQRTGQAPAAHLRAARLQRASDLLRETTHEVAHIGRIVGYRSPAAFGRAFRRRFGCSPGRWRRRENGDATGTAGS